MPVISEPVPAVVGTQTIGTDFSGSGCAARRKSETGASGAEHHRGELARIERRAAAEADDRLRAVADLPSCRAASTCASFGSPAISA